MTRPAQPRHAAAHFPNEAASAGGARRFVTSTLSGWGLNELDEVACLLVSELVSNALLHAGTELDVHVSHARGRLRVEVHDCSPRLPERKFYSTTSVTGRGLVFVSELAESWGFEPSEQGKAVWFELDEATVASAPVAVGAELRLEDWDDLGGWDDGAPPAGRNPADAPAAGHEASSGGHGASRARRGFVGVR